MPLGVDGHDGATLPGLQPAALVFFPGPDFEAGEAGRPHAGGLPGGVEIAEPAPQVGAVSGQLGEVGEFRDALGVALLGLGFQKPPLG